MSLLDFLTGNRTTKALLESTRAETRRMSEEIIRLQDQVEATHRENEWLRKQVEAAQAQERFARESMTNMVWRWQMGFSPYPEGAQPPKQPETNIPRAKTGHYMETLREGKQSTMDAINQWNERVQEIIKKRNTTDPSVDPEVARQVAQDTETLVG